MENAEFPIPDAEASCKSGRTDLRNLPSVIWNRFLYSLSVELFGRRSWHFVHCVALAASRLIYLEAKRVMNEADQPERGSDPWKTQRKPARIEDVTHGFRPSCLFSSADPTGKPGKRVR
jgi:hypothetical protein